MSEPTDTGIYGTPTYWRATMTMPRLLMFDARLIIPFTILIFHLRWSTFFLLCGSALVLWLVEHYGYSFPNAMRAIRSMIAGRDRPAVARSRFRQTRDFAFETHPLVRHRMEQRMRALENVKRVRLKAKEDEQRSTSTGDLTTATNPAAAPA